MSYLEPEPFERRPIVMQSQFQWAELFSVKAALGLMVMVGMGIFIASLAVRYGSLKAENAELAKHALEDVLTGLPNWRSFSKAIEEEIARTGRMGATFGVLFAEVDDFKSVNDKLGHAVGDRTLREIGGRLRDYCRISDTVARLGGDEFGIIIPGADRMIAMVKAEDMSVAIQSYSENDKTFSAVGVDIGLSIGVAVFPIDGQSMDELMTAADSNMYVAKGMNGKARRLPVG